MARILSLERLSRSMWRSKYITSRGKIVIRRVYKSQFIFPIKHLFDNTMDGIHYTMTTGRELPRLKVNKDKVNVLCVIRDMTLGGAERVMLNIVKGLDKEKYDFHLVATYRDNAWANKFAPFFKNIIVMEKRPVNQKFFNLFMNQVVEKLDIDILFTYNAAKGYRYLPSLKKHFLRVVTFDIMHAEESEGARIEFIDYAEYLDKRVCISKHLKNYLASRYMEKGISELYNPKLLVIYNGIDITPFLNGVNLQGQFKERMKIRPDVKIITFIGRITSEEKNPELFISVAQRFLSMTERDDVLFVMAGDGPDLLKCKNIITQHGLNKQFIFTGVLDDKGVIELLADSEIMLVTSHNEGIPFTILESMAMKVPVISTDVGAIHEVIRDEETGFLVVVDQFMVDSFIDKINHLLSNSDVRELIADNAFHDIISKYTLNSMVSEYQNLFKELCSEKSKHK